ncbi:hypothetical protein [Acidimangrovimonas sediminis]|uniref:hypothetical protein n=1 Tax=Acidimangrovimonas sediminis TaxID=2056283 RepID=UPI0011AEE12F|nr:hypothetical protein [Acidimangrovimonas sediminis]
MSKLAKPPGFLAYSKSVAEMRRFLCTPGARKFVISAEAFSFARDPGERRKIEGLFAKQEIKVIPVLCLRSGGDWRESWADYLRRWDPEGRQSYGKDTDNILGDWYFDTEAILQFWSAIGPVRIVDYDAAIADPRADGSILPALYAAMEIAMPAGDARLFLNTRI